MISAASRKEALQATRIKYQQRLTPKQLSMLDDIPFTALFLILWAAVASGRAEWLWVHLLWNDARIQLDQNWQFQTRNDTDYHCTYALTTVNGSRMAFNFTGTEFIINGPETGAGRLDVYDNGREILNFDLPRITDDMSCGAELLRYPLPMGQHTIELIFRPNGANDTYGIEYVWYSFPTSTASVTSATVTNTGATSAGSHRYSAEVVVGAALGGAFGFAY
ncbi:hypothetical protein FRC02_010365 [Tulasnella sp. 418]|nr:hypothetical protein FRC02_010365 [Tulasnella sp. 418]